MKLRTLGPCLLLLGACIGDIGDVGTGEGVDDPGTHPEGSRVYAPSGIRRLTPFEYGETLRFLFDGAISDAEIAEAIARLPQPDVEFHNGYTTIAARAEVPAESEVQTYEELAFRFAAQAMQSERRADLVGCSPDSREDACLEDFVVRFGQLAFRRPLTDEEKARHLEVIRTAGESDDPWDAVALGVASFLSAPSFLYRVELGGEADAEGLRPIRGYEMATRLSFFLLGRTPDQALLDRATAGELDTAEGVADVARDLWRQPEAKRAMAHFFSEYLGLERLDYLAKDASVFPEATASLGPAMRHEIELLIQNELIENDRSLTELLTSRDTWVNDELYDLYGLQFDESVARPAEGEWIPVTFPEEWQRGGLLTTGAFLALQARPQRTSPTLRGHWVRSMLMCDEIGAPPPNVETNLDDAFEDSDEPRTLRETQEDVTGGVACQGCHSLMDPIGFALESFDGLGRHRSLDNGFELDTTGEVGAAPVDGAQELSRALADSDRVAPCVARQIYRYGLGHLEGEEEVEQLAPLGEAYAERGLLEDLVVAIVSTDGFRTVSSTK